MTLYDITRPISPSTVVWEGDPLPRLDRVQSLASGDAYNLTRLDISAHTATHVDAPLHFVPGGAGVDALPLDVLTGPAWVLDCAGQAEVSADLLESAMRMISAGDAARVLLKTRPPDSPVFDPAFPALSLSGARWLIARGARLVGIDTISIEGYASVNADAAVHKALLQAGIIIVENLDLAAVPPGRYRLTCLPLKLAGADGAPARAILESEGA